MPFIDIEGIHWFEHRPRMEEPLLPHGRYDVHPLDIHKTLKVSPAMPAGVTDRLWSLDDVVAKIHELASAPAKSGPYKKRLMP